MQTTLISESKFIAPHFRGNLVEREALLNRIMSAMPVRVVGLVAPGGFGKTVLAKMLLDRTPPGHTVGWLRVDERDSDPVRFWMHLVELLRRLEVSVDDRPLGDLADDDEALDELVIGIANALLQRPDEQFVIVLDDVHRIRVTSSSQRLQLLIDAAPPNLTLIFTSRTRPPWRLQRLLQSGEAQVLGEASLAFTSDQTAALLETNLGRDTGSDDVASEVFERTGGWPVAVQLASQSLGSSSPSRTGRQHSLLPDASVAGEFLDEVLAHLTPEMQQFWFDLSTVESVNIDLARALTSPGPDIDIADVLHESSLIGYSDEAGEWYEMHQLVRSLLQDQMRRVDAERYRRLNERAAHWFHDAGNFTREIEHLFAADRFDHAAERVLEFTDRMWVSGQLKYLLEWLRRLPADRLAPRPDLVSQLGVVFLVAGRLDEARGHVERAESAAKTDVGRVAALYARIMVEWSSGEAQTAIDTIAELKTYEGVLSDEDGPVADYLAPARWYPISAISHEFLGNDEEHAAAIDSLDSVDREERLRKSPSTVAAIDPLVARYHADKGNLAIASAKAQTAIGDAASSDSNFFLLTHAHLALAQVAWCNGRLADAEASLAEATRLDSGLSAFLSTSRRLRAADIFASDGRLGLTAEVLADAWRGDNRRPSTVVQANVAGWGVWIFANQSEGEEALRWSAELEKLTDFTRLPAPLWARLQLLQGAPGQVIDRFDAGGQGLPTSPLSRIRTGLVLAESLHAVGAQTEARDLVATLVKPAEQQGLLQPIIDSPARALISEVVHAHDGSPGTLHTLLGPAATPDPVIPMRKRPIPELIDQLSEREYDLVPFLATRKTNREVAQELYVSVNTVKTHLRSIYRKLGVANRDEAVIRCADLGLTAVMN